MDNSGGKRGIALIVVLVVASIAAAAAAVVAWQRADDRSAAAEELAAERAEFEFERALTRIDHLVVAEMTHQVESRLSSVERAPNPVDLSDVEATLRDVSVHDHVAGVAAGELLDQVVAVDATDFASMVDVTFGFTPAQRPYPTEPDLAAVRELVDLSLLPLLVAHEATVVAALPLDASVESSGEALDSHLVEVADIALQDPGWLGPEGADDLSTGVMYVELLPERLPEVFDATVASIRASEIPALDAWIVERVGAAGAESPVPLDRFVELGLEGSSSLLQLVDETLDAAVSEIDAEIETLDASSTRWRAVAASLAVLALVGAAIATVLVIRRSRATRRMLVDAMTDHLTGVGNRRQLHERTEALLADPAFSCHALAVVDLDRFKIINDSFGHATGDRVLIEVARELQRAADRFVVDRPEGAATVVRLGGDEFAVSFHAADSLSRSELVAMLGAADGRRMSVGHDEVTIRYSIGIVVAEGRPELDDLLATADLRSYEAKRGRHAVVDVPVVDH